MCWDGKHAVDDKNKADDVGKGCVFVHRKKAGPCLLPLILGLCMTRGMRYINAQCYGQRQNAWLVARSLRDSMVIDKGVKGASCRL